MLKIGITGAAGFVGKALTEKLLLNKKNKVRVFSRGLPKSMALNKNPNLEIFNGDIVENGGLKRFVKGCDIVVHLAGTFDPPFGNLFRVNVKATENLLHACAKEGMRRVLFLSSIAVYGECHKQPAKEKDIPLPNTPYGLTKYIAEEVLSYYYRVFEIKSTIFRMCSIYGPGNNKGVVYNFIQSILNNKAVIIYGDGKQTRDYVYIDDAVDAIIAGISKKGGNREVYNVSSGSVVTLLDLIRVVECTIGRKLKTEFRREDKNVNRYLAENNNKIVRELKWAPKTVLKEGIEKTLQHYGII